MTTFDGLGNGTTREVPDAGAVHIVYGSASGLTSAGNQLFDQAVGKEDNDRFGAALASGDFNGDPDGRDELVVGAPHAFVTTIRAGRVTVLSGTATGVNPEPAQEINEPAFSAPLDDTDAETGDQFGAALAVGDFNGDGDRDLAVGAPGEDIGNSPTTGGIGDAGSVSIFTGNPAIAGVPSFSFAQKLTQNSPGIELAEANDVFGAALAANNFNGDTFADLAIGAPGEALSGQAGAGAVSVIYGTSPGLSTTASAGHPAHQFLHEDVTGFSSTTEAGDRFGTSLSVWNFGNGAQADLIIGVPFETINVLVSQFVFRPIADAGAVHALYGSSTGLLTGVVQFWNQNSSGILEEAKQSDQFGSSVY